MPDTYQYINNYGRGLAPRHLLAHAGIDYKHEKFEWRTSINDPDVDKPNHLLTQWPAVKPELQKSNPFALLPYVVTENGVIISSTSAILVYLGRKAKYLTGYDKTYDAPRFCYKLQAALDLSQDTRESFIRALFAGKESTERFASKEASSGPGPWTNLGVFEMQLTQQIDNCKRVKASGAERTYMFDHTTPSIVDCYMFSNIFIMKQWHSQLLADYPKLQAWYDFMLENEGLAKEVNESLERKEAFFWAS